jgi:hypothetical protein
MSFVIGRDSLPAMAQGQTPAQRKNRRGVLFLRWLRKIHLYVGLWGAAMGLLFGATGIVMNHRAVLKIPIEKVVQRSAQLALPDAVQGGFASADEMASWLQRELGFQGLQVRTKAEPTRKVTWGERELLQPARWTFSFNSPHKAVNAEYLVGNRYLKVDTQDATVIGTLTRLHNAVGVTAFWVLLSDTIAGGLIVLSVTGLLLWSRLHGVRLATLAVSLAALGAAIGFVWSAT